MHWTPLSGAHFEDVFGPQGKSKRAARLRQRRHERRAKAKPRLESLETRVTPAAPTVGIVSSSLASTADNNATIGEVVRFRVRANEQLTGAFNPAGTYIRATLPAGLQLLPGSATIALVSDQGMISNLDPAGTGGLNVSGNNANVDGITPTFTLPSGAITVDPATGALIFNTGISQVADNDANNEYIVIEFNALVLNVPGNRAEIPTQLNSSFLVFIDGVTCGCVGTGSVTVVEPNISDQTKVGQVNAAGDTANYTLTFSNTGNSTAYDVRVVDNLPAGLTIVPGSLNVVGGTGMSNQSNSTTVDLSFQAIAAGGQVTITYAASIPAALRNGQPITNTANLLYTSLPGPFGTVPNPTGTNTPGNSGTSTGQRDGSGGVNNYSDSAQSTVQTQGGGGAPNSVSGWVFGDTNKNGSYNVGDALLAGAVIRILNADGTPVTDLNGNLVGPVTTGADGAYSFTNLPDGTYQVIQDFDEKAFGYDDGLDFPGLVNGNPDTDAQTDPIPGDRIYNIVLVGGCDGTEYLFGECPCPASISGHVYFDLNCDGLLNNGDTPLPGVVIQLLDANGNPILVGGAAVTTTTDANGFWQFIGLDPGTYQVREVQPTTPGLVDGSDVLGTVNGTVRGTTAGNDTFQVTLSAGDVGVNYDFFECPANTQISGHVYFDFNCDGILNNGDTPLPGVVIQLLDAAGNPILVGGTAVTTTTDANGFWQFANLAAGTYQVREVQPATPGLIDGLDVLGTVNGTVRGTAAGNDTFQVTLDAGDVGINYDFFECPAPTQISGHVYFDFNCDGILNNGDTPLPGVVIQLLDAAGNPILVGGAPVTTTTDANGLWQFTGLAAGTYQVREVQPTTPGLTDGLDVLGTVNGTARGTAVGNDTFQVTLDAGDIGVNYDFFECPVNTQISGFVFFDVDCDGIKEAADTGLAGVSVQLTDLNGNAVTDINGNVVGIIQTDATGFYQFLNLAPGSYRVTELPPQPTFQGDLTIDGLDTAGTVNGVTRGTAMNDLITGITLAAGESSINNNFGECQARVGALSLSGHVYFDSNRDKLRDQPDLPIGGATVLLFRLDQTGINLVAQTTTNDRGEYLFQIDTPGIYRSVLAPVANLIKWVANVGRVNGVTRGTATLVDLLDNILLNDGEAGTDYDFGLIANILPPPPFSKQQLLANIQGGTGGGTGGTGVGGLTQFNTDPTFTNINPNAVGTHILAVGTDAGGGPHVRVFNFSTGQPLFSFFAYDPRFAGGVRVATGDVTGDGVPDVITAPGFGGGPHIKVFSGATGELVREFFAYDPSFQNGVYVTAGDVNGDGIADIITGAGEGGGPHVKVFDGATGAMIREFYAYDPSFRGGVRLAAGDFNADGRADIVTGAGPGGGPHVRVFDGTTGALITEFFAFESAFTGGVNVASNSNGAADVTGDGRADIVVGAGSGAARVRVYSGVTFGLETEFTAFDPSIAQGGARVGLFDLNGDGRADVVVGSGGGIGAFVRVSDLRTGRDVEFFQAYDPAFTGGVFVSAS